MSESEQQSAVCEECRSRLKKPNIKHTRSTQPRQHKVTHVTSDKLCSVGSSRKDADLFSKINMSCRHPRHKPGPCACFCLSPPCPVPTTTRTTRRLSNCLQDSLRRGECAANNKAQSKDTIAASQLMDPSFDHDYRLTRLRAGVFLTQDTLPRAHQ